MQTMTISEAATEALSYFETKQRDNGESFVSLRDGHPEWVEDMVREAHGDMLPEDWRYKAIEEVITAISENEYEGEDDANDSASEVCDSLVSVYTHELTQWLASSNARIGYLDEAVREAVKEDGASILLMQAQYREYMEVYSSVVQSLAAYAEDKEWAE